jgi:hypothetical protein
MVSGNLGPLWAKGLVPRVIVIYTPYPFGCKMVLIRYIPCLLSLAQGRLGTWLCCHKREGRFTWLPAGFIYSLGDLLTFN